MFSKETCIILHGIQTKQQKLMDTVKSYLKQGISMIIVSSYKSCISIKLHNYATVIYNDRYGYGTNKIGNIYTNNNYNNSKTNIKITEIKRALVVAKICCARAKYCFIIDVNLPVKNNLVTCINYELGYQCISNYNSKLFDSLEIGKTLKYLESGKKYSKIHSINYKAGIIKLVCYDNNIVSVKAKKSILEDTIINLVNYVIAYDSVEINKDKVMLLRESEDLNDVSSPCLGYKVTHIETNTNTSVLLKLISGETKLIKIANDTVELINSTKYITDIWKNNGQPRTPGIDKDKIIENKVIFQEKPGNWNINDEWCFGTIKDLDCLYDIDYEKSSINHNYIYSKKICDNESTNFFNMSDKYFSYNNNLV
jgi:hypothetical protein